MVALAKNTDLMGLGMPAALAALAGDSYATVTATGTTQGAAAALTCTINNVTTAGGQTAVILPSTWPQLSSIAVYVNTATTGVVFPPSGNTINQGAADASISVAQGKMTILVRVSNTAWLTLAGA